ncbi:hypothetical protein [Streptomyces sp. Tu 3180]|uniref:hypothetical protein n=1 Tax=Streptomyces sp. Tu 3180 TaxID=2682611 RepID=UPI00135B008B|nr:hypothetical protein [Streptomyces sp. Tu 3180]KAF3463842.1 hypothetical protein GL259_05680 [Streptomyces sp. Tu 3180]
MSMRKTALVLAAALAVIAVTAGCHTQAPNPPDFGYARGPEGGLVIAYPICPGDTVSGAEIYADDDDFTTLWKARGPRSAETAQGFFDLGSDADFAKEEQPLRGKLPDGFYVTVFEEADGKEEEGRDGWIDLSRLEGARLGEGEFMTHTGKVMTRTDINAQLSCS